MRRDRGQCFIQVNSAIVDRDRAMRRPSESYSSVLLRLVELRSREPDWTTLDSLEDCGERGSVYRPKTTDDAAEGRLSPVAHPSQEAALQICQQTLGVKAPFVAVLAHCVMVRLKAGDEAFQALELGLHGGETCE